MQPPSSTSVPHSRIGDNDLKTQVGTGAVVNDRPNVCGSAGPFCGTKNCDLSTKTRANAGADGESDVIISDRGLNETEIVKDSDNQAHGDYAGINGFDNDGREDEKKAVGNGVTGRSKHAHNEYTTKGTFNKERCGEKKRSGGGFVKRKEILEFPPVNTLLRSTFDVLKAQQTNDPR